MSKCQSDLDSSRFRYTVNIVQQDQEIDLAHHLIREGAALSNVDFAEQLFPKSKVDDRISSLARRRSLIHLAHDLFICPVSSKFIFSD